jgi:hypothetical protein
MRVAKACLWLALFVALSAGRQAGAASMMYALTGGQLTAVTLDFDATNRLAAPVSLDAGQVNVDFTGLQVHLLSVGATGPGLVNLGGINNWDSVTFTNANFSSTAGGALTLNTPNNYNYGLPVSVLADLSLDPVGPGSPVLVDNFTASSGATGTIIALNGDSSVDITVNGVVLGALQDPINPTAPLVLVKADFHFTANQVPEPMLPALLGLFGLTALALRRVA